MVQRTGTRLHRRMRVHMSTWVQPNGQSLGTYMRQTVGDAAAAKLGGRVPQALVSAARDRLAPSLPPAPVEPPDPALTSTPHVVLTQARQKHREASAATAEMSARHAAVMRLGGAVASQERCLNQLSLRLGHTASPVPAHRNGRGAVDVGRLIWQAEDYIDAVEELGARPRRLPSWSSRGGPR
jgi:hypothetical protein